MIFVKKGGGRLPPAPPEDILTSKKDGVRCRGGRRALDRGRIDGADVGRKLPGDGLRGQGAGAADFRRVG
ncbi:hypothetical protein GCM10011341_16660 [Frigidibacter albus]|nr:hypothetical protein GCM10011341_16660 [Frigidibacter albus]